MAWTLGAGAGRLPSPHDPPPPDNDRLPVSEAEPPESETPPPESETLPPESETPPPLRVVDADALITFVEAPFVSSEPLPPVFTVECLIPTRPTPVCKP